MEINCAAGGPLSVEIGEGVDKLTDDLIKSGDITFPTGLIAEKLP